MPIQHYGVWRGTITAWYPTQKDNDHGHISFTDNSNKTLDCAVNISSQSPDSRLVYWFNRAFQHPLTSRLENLDRAFKTLKGSPDQGPNGLALDLLRDNLVDINAGVILGLGDGLGGSDKKDILDYLDPIMTEAVSAKADIFLFGQLYWPDKDGIHDIHMNQGSADFVDSNGKDHKFSQDNGVWQDGGIVLRFPSDGHWEAVFLAFASQASKTTDDGGQPDGETFAELLDDKAPPATGGDGDGGETGGTGGEEKDADSGNSKFVAIQAALVNPVGPDDNPTSGDKEHVFLMNTATKPVSVGGWTIANGAGQSFKLPEGTTVSSQDKKKIMMPQSVPLSNKGGSIVVKRADGQVVDKVQYTRKQGQAQGRLLYFK